MAVARWRRSRLLEFEASLLSSTMDKVKAELGDSATRVQIQATALERLIDGSKTWATLSRYLKDTERTINNCMKHLVVQPVTEAVRKPQPLPEPPRKNEANSPSPYGPKVPLRPNGYPVNLALAL